MTSQNDDPGVRGPFSEQPHAGAATGQPRWPAPRPVGPPGPSPYAPYAGQGNGAPGYGQFPFYTQAPVRYGQAPATNTMAILAIVFTFIFAPVGIVFAAIGRRQIARTGEEGATMATVAMVVSVVLTSLGVLAFTAYIVVIALVISHVHDFPVPSGNPFATPSGQGV